MNANFIFEALEESKKSTHRVRIGAVIYNKGSLISRGYNQPFRSVKSVHPFARRWKTSLHAEVSAILNAKRDLKGCSITVVRLNRASEIKIGKPCSHCLDYIDYVGIKRVFFSDNDGKIKEFKL